MAGEKPKYDVAISFLSQDLTLAQALYDKLCVGLEVFFFPRKQEALAGTEGLESMRAPFRHESRLSVVLCRHAWGNTQWTAVEEVAIKECCLENSFRNIFVYVIEKGGALPKWLPETHVYFSAAHYSLDEAVGAIKARVQDRGGEYKPLTPARKAELNRAEDDYRLAKLHMYSDEGIANIHSKVDELFDAIRKQCDEVNAAGAARIEYLIDRQQHAIEEIITRSGPRVSLIVVWFQAYRNRLEGSFLGVREFNERMSVPPGYVRIQHADLVKEAKYEPDISRGLEYGWTPQKGQKDFLSSMELANQCVIQFLDLVNRDSDGKVRRKNRY